MANSFTAEQYRKKALISQGLHRHGSFGRGTSGALACIQQLGYLQIDTISVVQRAHHHVLWSRVPGYSPSMLDKLVQRKDVFEYWAHAAAYLPMEHYRFALPRMNAIKSGEKHWFANTDRKLMAKICTRIREEGPLMARDFADQKNSQSGWWEWKPAKQALEQLFMEGDLMIVDRQGFQKVYNLTERALPDGVDLTMPDTGQLAQYFIDTVIKAHGFATLKSFTYLRKGKEIRDAVKEQLADLVNQQALVESTLPCGTAVYCDPQMTSRKKIADRVALLSPFDNCVIQRQRCQDIFNFEFQIECYVPESKRQYGYFCLPILYRDQFVGRVDCKAVRKQQTLEIRRVHLHKQVDKNFRVKLVETLTDFAAFNECSNMELACKSAASKALAAHL